MSRSLFFSYETTSSIPRGESSCPGRSSLMETVLNNRLEKSDGFRVIRKMAPREQDAWPLLISLPSGDAAANGKSLNSVKLRKVITEITR